jgi:hypothetical protein
MEGKMRKQISLVVFIIFLVSFVMCDFKQVQSDTILNNPPPDFSIVAYKTLSYKKRKIIDLEKPSPLISYKDGIITFYEIEEKKDESDIYYAPKLDENNNPIPVAYNDKDIINKIKSALRPTFQAKIEGPQNTVALGVCLPYNGIGHWFYNLYKKNIEPDDITRVTMSVSTSKFNSPVGSIFYLDDNYNFEIYAYHGYSHQLDRREAINPDNYSVYDVPGFLRIGEVVYKNSYCQGYLWMKADSGEICINGKNIVLDKPSLIHEGDKLALDINLLSDVIFSPAEGDGKSITIYRFCELVSGQIEPVKVTFKLGEKTALLNGEPAKLSFEPFLKENQFFVPFFDVCKLLKTNCHYRTTDNTALVARFFAPMSE